MSREQMIEIVMEELNHEITILFYQEERVRKRLVAAFIRISNKEIKKRVNTNAIQSTCLLNQETCKQQESSSL